MLILIMAIISAQKVGIRALYGIFATELSPRFLFRLRQEVLYLGLSRLEIVRVQLFEQASEVSALLFNRC